MEPDLYEQKTMIDWLPKPATITGSNCELFARVFLSLWSLELTLVLSSGAAPAWFIGMGSTVASLNYMAPKADHKERKNHHSTGN